MKSRNWTFIHYREHGNQRQLAEFLSSANLMYAISPRHVEGKHHYHVVLQFSGPTTEKSIIKEIIEPLGDPVYIQKVYSMSGIDKYLTHDNVSKKKYDRKKIIYSDNWKVADDDDNYQNNLDLLLSIIRDKNITRYNHLVSEVLSLNNSKLLEFVIVRAYAVDKLLSSRYSRYEGLRRTPTPAGG